MRALTVRQPWATCIIPGPGQYVKNIENRTWTTTHRGRIAIHSAQQIDREAMRWILGTPREFGDEDVDQGDWPMGKILGTVNLVGIHEANSRGAECAAKGCFDHFDRVNQTGSWGQAAAPGKILFHWELADPHTFETPWAVKGALQLWTLGPSDEGLVRMEEQIWTARN